MNKLLINQRVPAYFRKPFFEYLNKACHVCVYSGLPNKEDSIKTYGLDSKLFFSTDVSYYFGGMFYFDLGWKDNIVEVEPDVVVITPTPRMLSNYLLIRYCKSKSIPVIGWGMGEMPGYSKVKRYIHRMLAKTMVNKLDHMICYSNKAKSYYESCGLLPSKVTVSPNSIDTKSANLYYNKLLNEPSLLSEYKNKFNISEEKFIILFIGRLTESKKVDELIRVFRERKFENAELIIVGDGVYRHELEKLRGENSSIKFLGYLDGEELASVCTLSNLFVLPSLGGLALNQAMLYSLPVIASEGDGTEEDLITHGYNGYLFPSGDYDVMASYISDIIDSNLSTEFGARSRERILQEFSIENMVNIFSEVISKKYE